MKVFNNKQKDKKFIFFNSLEKTECPQKQEWMGKVVSTNSSYCRSLCKYRRYSISDIGSDYIACKIKKGK